MPSSAFVSLRDLHSFPTRRSSDLQGRVRHLGRRQSLQSERAVGSAADVPATCRGRACLPDGLEQLFTECRLRLDARGEGRTSAQPRSEEHTSELQSLRHLVCRLLLSSPSAIYTLSLHDALPIFKDVYGISGVGNLFNPNVQSGQLPTFRQLAEGERAYPMDWNNFSPSVGFVWTPEAKDGLLRSLDRKSTRLNSSHLGISYAVFCFRLPPRSTLFPYTTLFRSSRTCTASRASAISSIRTCSRVSCRRSGNLPRASVPTRWTGTTFHRVSASSGRPRRRTDFCAA